MLALQGMRHDYETMWLRYTQNAFGEILGCVYRRRSRDGREVAVDITLDSTCDCYIFNLFSSNPFIFKPIQAKQNDDYVLSMLLKHRLGPRLYSLFSASHLRSKTVSATFTLPPLAQYADLT